MTMSLNFFSPAKVQLDDFRLSRTRGSDKDSVLKLTDPSGAFINIFLDRPTREALTSELNTFARIIADEALESSE